MKLLVDLPDELYDTLRSKTLNLTSDARSNGKHLVYELIGCVLNGTVVEKKQSDRELFESICEKYGVKKDNEGNGLRIITEDGQVKPLTKELLHEIFPFDIPFVTGLSADSADVPECETWSNNEEPIEIKYGEKNLIKSDCAHCSDSVSYTKINGEVLYACPLLKCKYEAETVMNCEVCKHRKQYKNVDTGRVIRGCDSWECNFERR